MVDITCIGEWLGQQQKHFFSSHGYCGYQRCCNHNVLYLNSFLVWRLPTRDSVRIQATCWQQDLYTGYICKGTNTKFRPPVYTVQANNKGACQRRGRTTTLKRQNSKQNRREICTKHCPHWSSNQNSKQSRQEIYTDSRRLQKNEPAVTVRASLRTLIRDDAAVWWW